METIPFTKVRGIVVGGLRATAHSSRHITGTGTLRKVYTLNDNDTFDRIVSQLHNDPLFATRRARIRRLLPYLMLFVIGIALLVVAVPTNMVWLGALGFCLMTAATTKFVAHHRRTALVRATPVPHWKRDPNPSSQR